MPVTARPTAPATVTSPTATAGADPFASGSSGRAGPGATRRSPRRRRRSVTSAYHRPESLRWQVFRGSQARAEGLLTPRQLRGPAWVRIAHDAYADSRLDRDHALACHAARLWMPPYAAIAGPSAAYLYGVTHAAGSGDEVHVVVPADRRMEPRAGVRVHRVTIGPDEIDSDDWWPRTTPLRTAWDSACWLDTPSAVAVVDGMLKLGLVDHTELRALVRARPGRRGVRRAERVFNLADGRAESAPESHLRVLLVTAGLPRPVPQHPVPVADGVLHPDLCWPRYRVAIEYDGEWHASAEHLQVDRRRLNRLVAEGWLVLHATGRSLYRDPEALLRETAAALRSRGWDGLSTD